MAKRVSTEIGYKGAQSIYYATREVAEYAGLPLNTLVTINFSMSEIRPEDATEAFGLIRNNHLGKWARRPCKGAGEPYKLTYAYAFENARENDIYLEMGEGKPHNVHVLWYVHVPPKRRFDFENRLYQAVDYVLGSECPEGTIKIQDVHQDNGVGSYLIKGSKKVVAARFGASKKYSPQGVIVGKRTGTSTNIGASARLRMDEELSINRLTRLRHAA